MSYQQKWRGNGRGQGWRNRNDPNRNGGGGVAQGKSGRNGSSFFSRSFFADPDAAFDDVAGIDPNFEDPNSADVGFGPILAGKDAEMDPSLKGAYTSEERLEELRASNALDEIMGFSRIEEKEGKLGWLVNMQPSLVIDNIDGVGRAAIDFYFIEEDGQTFKATALYDPYFYVVCKPGTESDVEDYIRRRWEKVVKSTNKVYKDDLKLPNHLVGHKRVILKITTPNVANLLAIRKVLLPAAGRNKAKRKATEAYEDGAIEFLDDRNSDDEQPGDDVGGAGTDFGFGIAAVDGENHFKHSSRSGIGATNAGTKGAAHKDPLDFIMDLREYDVPYYVRAAIDNDFRVGYWYNVRCGGGTVTLERRDDKVKRAEPVVFAFDIETTKLPLKFPDPEVDNIMMISYMIDGQGFLITNREIVSEDIEDFEYTPKPEYEGCFTISNEPNESSLLRRFFDHIREVKPKVYVSYNGDFFDWPFIEKRALANGYDMKKEIGVSRDSNNVYSSLYGAHLDCFYWVKRDSYLPQGSQGLKAVTTNKLGYNPMELDPEDMTKFASERPQTLAQYSVSDAVATYYLYMKYVNPFIFSLCNIIPMNPDEVLRRGSGTLCETLLMVQAYKANVIMPNKHVDEAGKTFDGHLLESETYVGGHVEALEAGVFRNDLPVNFKLAPEGLQTLIDEVDSALHFSIVNEAQLSINDVTNYEEVKSQIISALTKLRDQPNRSEEPLIYHLDVAAMYPNIILTNRLQPDAMVDESFCAACDFNDGPGTLCQRRMQWSWRGEYYPAKRSEYNMIRNQLETERFPGDSPDSPVRTFHELRKAEQHAILKKRISDYSKKVYKKMYENKVVSRESIVCQRENPFYVDTVRNFRDRRYEYKGLLKTWKKKHDDAKKHGNLKDIEEADKLIVVYDSLQLAHKCILNSFYGYVMRKGARWFSMEMAGIVCLTGAKIIQLARSRVDQIGRPLELDTDGIWCILPKTFPENFTFNMANGKTLQISYPCVMLNHLVHDKFTNHQYHDLEQKDKFTYSVRSENSIFFEVDGPYRAMILPSSTEEDKLLKKRYAVFNDNGSLAELKGFEVKRRGELKLIKIFQKEIFGVFLNGTTLQECYEAVAAVANKWLDILWSKGADLSDEELFELISENRSMSKSLEEYGGQKSTSISTAKRLAEFLGDQMVKDKGLTCRYVISAKPKDTPVSERAIPVAIFSAEPQVRRHFLRKWLKDSGSSRGSGGSESNGGDEWDIRQILDWQYYLDRFSSVIRKIITIPAAMQKIINPVPRVPHPDWLSRRLAILNDKNRQNTLVDMFQRMREKEAREELDQDALIEAAEEDVESDLLGRSAMEIENTPIHKGVDIEDAISDPSSNGHGLKGKMVATVHKHVRSGKSVLASRNRQQVVPDVMNGEVCPPITGPYRDWLAFQKRKWQRQRDFLYRKQQEELDDTSDDLPRKRLRIAPGSALPGGGGMVDFLRRQTNQIMTSDWHIVQITETDIPGEFRVWAMVRDQLHALKMSVPRIFYVNSRVPNPAGSAAAAGGIKISRCTKVLPRSHPCLNLYEFRMGEDIYRKNINVFSTFFNDPGIEGVYETQVPLLFRAMMQLSCIARVGQERRKIQSGSIGPDRYDLYDLQPETNGATYLNPDVSGRTISVLQHIYIYHACSENNAHQIIGIFFTALGKGSAFFVDRRRRKDQIPSATRIYAETETAVVQAKGLDKISELTPTQHSWSQVGVSQAETVGSQKGDDEGRSIADFQYPSCMVFETLVHGTEQEALGAVNQALREYQDQRRGPTMLIIQSPRTPRMLAAAAPSILDFPNLTIPSLKQDRQFPALGWQLPQCRAMMSHYFELSAWLADHIALARYASLPLCNLEHDYLVFMGDLLVARRLTKQDMILWYSTSGKPDLGGREEDDYASTSSLLTRGDVLSASNPEINHSGAYYNVCIEMDLRDLAHNAVLQSHLVNNLEETGESSGFSGSGATYETQKATEKQPERSQKQSTTEIATEPTASFAVVEAGENEITQKTFRVIKDLVKSWVAEARLSRSRFALMLLGHLQRWLTTSTSKFFDPAFNVLLNTMMSKVLLQLLAEFRRLGSMVVHASLNKVILVTTKVSTATAQKYATWVLDAVRKKPLFQYIDLQPRTFYEALLWMDQYNMAGLAWSDQTEQENPKSTSEADDEEGDEGGAAKQRTSKRRRILDDDEESPDHEHQPMQADQGSNPQPKLVLTMHWNIMEYLPPRVQPYFVEVLQMYMKTLHESRISVLSGIAIDIDTGEDDGPAEGLEATNGMTTTGRGSKLIGLLQRHVETTVKRRVLQIVDGLNSIRASQASANTDPDFEFPKPAGSHLDLTLSKASPPLEFAKMICTVLSLDRRLLDKVNSLKRDIFNLVNGATRRKAGIAASEFSAAAKFVNPCEPLKIPLVICEYCHFVREMDLTRDPDLNRNPNAGDDEDGASAEIPWECSECGQEYDKTQFEQKLIQMVYQLLAAWQLQDTQCRACRQVRAERMAINCRMCTKGGGSGSQGGFEHVGMINRSGGGTGAEDVMRRIRVMRNVAEIHKMEMLKDVVDWVLSR
ncbi:putative DNA polymerase epsilon catalytic subunit A [Cladochytrium replicatum]|nr:putative DNA polymerase epsilon catalytic subunit A [Cladochytrium replicatum]